MKQIEVVAAIIKRDNLFLCTQRDSGKYDYISYKYEFPGGKVEDGESNEEALCREINEELSITIDVKDFFMTVDHTYPDFNVRMHSFICEMGTEEPTLNDHVDYKWLPIDSLETLDWAAADLPIIDKLKGIRHD